MRNMRMLSCAIATAIVLACFVVSVRAKLPEDQPLPLELECQVVITYMPTRPDIASARVRGAQCEVVADVAMSTALTEWLKAGLAPIPR
jgi:hypothetical protein